VAVIMMPDPITRLHLIEAAARGDVRGMQDCFRWTENQAIIHKATSAFVTYAFRQCLRNPADDSLIPRLTGGLIALRDAQFEPRSLVFPPWKVLQLYRAHRDDTPEGLLERAADTLLSSMRPDVVEFNPPALRHSLLFHAIHSARCGPLVVNRLVECGCRRAPGELAEGDKFERGYAARRMD
jgi:hypothetical protein